MTIKPQSLVQKLTTLSGVMAVFTSKAYASSLMNLNPASNFGNSQNFLGDLISEVWPYSIVFGGLILFVMIISGGFTMLTGADNPQAQESGKKRITYAIAGFLLLFASYWIVQILEVLFNLDIV